MSDYIDDEAEVDDINQSDSEREFDSNTNDEHSLMEDSDDSLIVNSTDDDFMDCSTHRQLDNKKDDKEEKQLTLKNAFDSGLLL